MLFPIVFLRASVVLCDQDGKTTFHVGETQLELPPYFSLCFDENIEGNNSAGSQQA